MESRLIIRIKQLGGMARHPSHHAANVIALLDDMAETFAMMTKLSDICAELSGQVSKLSMENQYLQQQIDYLEKRKRDKWGAK